MSKNEKYLAFAAVIMLLLIVKAANNAQAAGYFGVDSSSWEE